MRKLIVFLIIAAAGIIAVSDFTSAALRNGGIYCMPRSDLRDSNRPGRLAEGYATFDIRANRCGSQRLICAAPDLEVQKLKDEECECYPNNVPPGNQLVVSYKNLLRTPQVNFYDVRLDDRELTMMMPSYYVEEPCPGPGFFIPLAAKPVGFLPIEADGDEFTDEFLFEVAVTPRSHNSAAQWMKKHDTRLSVKDAAAVEHVSYILVHHTAVMLDFLAMFDIEAGPETNLQLNFPATYFHDFNGDFVQEIASVVSYDAFHKLSIMYRRGNSYELETACAFVLQPGASNPQGFGFKYDPQDNEFECFGPKYDGAAPEYRYIRFPEKGGDPIVYGPNGAEIPRQISIEKEPLPDEPEWPMMPLD